MSIHVFTQKLPLLVAGMDDTATHLVEAENVHDARDALVEATGDPNTAHDGLRNDAGKAYNVQYHGTVEDLLAGDGEPATVNVHSKLDPDMFRTIDIDGGDAE